MKRTCDGCGKEFSSSQLRPVENRFSAIRWFCDKCWGAELRRREEFWNVHIGMGPQEWDD
jgi:hypothetical protein